MSQFRLYSKTHLSKFMSQVAELKIIPDEPELWNIWNGIEEVPISEKMFYGWMKGLMDNINVDPFDANDSKVFSHKRVEGFIRRIVEGRDRLTQVKQRKLRVVERLDLGQCGKQKVMGNLAKDDLRKLWLSISCQITRDNLSDYTKFLIEQLSCRPSI